MQLINPILIPTNNLTPEEIDAAEAWHFDDSSRAVIYDITDTDPLYFEDDYDV